jgi:hypothetical protein
MRRYGNAGYGGYAGGTNMMGTVLTVGLVALAGFAIWKFMMRRKYGITTGSTVTSSTACCDPCLPTTGYMGYAAPPPAVIPPLKQRTVLNEGGFVSKPINRRYIFKPTLWTRIKGTLGMGML